MRDAWDDERGKTSEEVSEEVNLKVFLQFCFNCFLIRELTLYEVENCN